MSPPPSPSPPVRTNPLLQSFHLPSLNPSVCCWADGAFVAVGTQAGGARGGGKLTIYPATADSVAIDGGVELESPHAAEVTCIAFSADGALMASSDKRSAGGNIALCACTHLPAPSRVFPAVLVQLPRHKIVRPGADGRWNRACVQGT